MAKTKTYKCTNYGICTEAEKETIFQETDIEEVDGKFVCPKCGQELEEIKQKPGVNWKLIVIILVAIVIATTTFFIIKQSSGSKNDKDRRNQEIADSLRRDSLRRDSLRIDSIKKTAIRDSQMIDSLKGASIIDSLMIDSLRRAAIKDSLRIDSLKRLSQKKAPAKYSLGWGIYEGQMQNGKPNGTGVVTVTKTYYIDLKDMPSRKVTVTKGDIIKEAYFKNGKLISGYIHYANKEAERILIGN